ncbi:MAG TPA: response regulator [Bdellovibrionota bacterium]|nr:response regulator [Bdellovibrionota bacterium]
MKTVKRILVVDDEKTILLSLAYALKMDGVDVITCNKVEWAEKALQNYYFDLIVTDVRLSKTSDREGMDIVELTKKRHPDTKVIVMTAFGSDEVREEAKRLGADQYFDKPIDLDSLLDAVERLGVPMKRRVPSSGAKSTSS